MTPNPPILDGLLPSDPRIEALSVEEDYLNEDPLGLFKALAIGFCVSAILLVAVIVAVFARGILHA